MVSLTFQLTFPHAFLMHSLMLSPTSSHHLHIPTIFTPYIFTDTFIS